MSPAEITEWDTTFRAWAPLDPSPQRRRGVNTLRCPIPSTVREIRSVRRTFLAVPSGEGRAEEAEGLLPGRGPIGQR